MRAGRPGLVGTVARTAVIAGTATVTAGAISSRQQNRANERAQSQQFEQDQAMQQQQELAQQAAAQQAAAAAPPSSDDMVTRITQLADLKAKGVLTDDEFQAAKAKLISGG